MKYAVHYAEAARVDIKRLYAYLPDRDETAAKRALSVIENGMKILVDFPFSCRKASPENSFLRELIIPFGSAGYVLSSKSMTAKPSRYWPSATSAKTITTNAPTSYRSLTSHRGLIHGSWLDRAAGSRPRMWSAAFSPVMIDGPLRLP